MMDAQTPSSQSPFILIVGLGETGVAAARWCMRQNWRLRIADTRAHPAGMSGLNGIETHAVEFCFGFESFAFALLDGITQLVLSPGLSPNDSPVKELLHEARIRKIPIVGEIELFAQALEQLSIRRSYAPQVIGITGTNGKTTVTALTCHMLEASGIDARVAGNISPAALDALMLALDQDCLPEVWVLELSSFQLETTHSLNFAAAVVLNITQDHLDWHGTLQAYTEAKGKIYKNARLRIYNRDDQAVMQLCADPSALDVRTFGREVPQFVGDVGLEASQDVHWLVRSQANEFEHEQQQNLSKRKKDAPAPSRPFGRVTRMMPSEALQIKGMHNALNTEVALLLASAVGASWGAMLRAAREYQGEPHRMEFVRSVRGVDFYNDSKGTNVGATVAGLNGLARRSLLIAGGQGKGQDFSPLISAVSRHAKHVFLIGEAADELAQVLSATGIPCEIVDTLENAVKSAFIKAEQGDAVLLSPACASFDMFKNYPHRGQSFVSAVTELALDQGELA